MVFRFYKAVKYYFSYERELKLLIKRHLEFVVRNKPGVVRVLDVGCGTTSMLSEVARDPVLMGRIYLVGLDVYEPTIEWNVINGFHSEYVLSDIRGYQPSKHYDVVIATDLIEHFEKSVALKLMLQLEAMSDFSLVLITPNGYQENTPLDDNFYMLHKCGFDVDELEFLKYVVRGSGGFRWMRGMYSLPVGNRKIMGFLLYFLSRALRLFPKQSFHLVATKLI
jgi:SAM-dependent methyltransferase